MNYTNINFMIIDQVNIWFFSQGYRLTFISDKLNNTDDKFVLNCNYFWFIYSMCTHNSILDCYLPLFYIWITSGNNKSANYNAFIYITVIKWHGSRNIQHDAKMAWLQEHSTWRKYGRTPGTLHIMPRTNMADSRNIDKHTTGTFSIIRVTAYHFALIIIFWKFFIYYVPFFHFSREQKATQ